MSIYTGITAKKLELGILFLALVVMTVFATSLTAWGDEGASGSLGEQLVRGFWAAMKAQDLEALENMFAPGFQSVHRDGARDREAELGLIADLDLGEYTLNEFKITRQGATIVVTYMVSVEETLAGTRTTSTPAPRLTIWIMTENGWQLLAHVNLKPMKEQ